MKQKKHFECECGKQFSSKKTLQRHKNSVHAEVKKVFQCEFCNLQFSRRDNLKTHQENICQFSVHKKKERFECKCGEQFSDKKGLQRHKYSAHDEVKNDFQCKCGKQFSDKRCLQRHENSVHAKKFFQCQFCDLKLSRKDKLKTHQEKVCRFAEKGKEKSKKA